MYTLSGLSWWLSGKESNARAIEDIGWIPESGRFLGGGHGNPLQYSCLEKPMDRGAWWATVHEVSKSRTRLKRKERPWEDTGRNGCLHGKERGL